MVQQFHPKHLPEFLELTGMLPVSHPLLPMAHFSEPSGKEKVILFSIWCMSLPVTTFSFFPFLSSWFVGYIVAFFLSVGLLFPLMPLAQFFLHNIFMLQTCYSQQIFTICNFLLFFPTSSFLFFLGISGIDGWRKSQRGCKEKSLWSREKWSIWNLLNFICLIQYFSPLCLILEGL